MTPSDTQTAPDAMADAGAAPAPLVCWTEIPVTDLESACVFYRAVFGWRMTIRDDPPNPTAFFNDEMRTIGGHLYPGRPAGPAGSVGPTVHLFVPDTVEAAAARVVAHGGTVAGPVIPLPPHGRFQYAADPDGNSIGLFETLAPAG